ncbi:MAG: M3 family metallopeptidase [Bacteroidales bacterium]
MRTILLLTLIITFMSSCNKKAEQTATSGDNPFFAEFDTPFGVPPFDKIKKEHYLPAIKEAIKRHSAEVDVIVNNSEAPTFDNTILAFDRSGEMLSRVRLVFSNINSADTDDEMQKLAREITPLTTAHNDEIKLNDKLFQRIKTVYDQRANLNLDQEQSRVLEKYYDDFVRSGANLSDEDKARMKKINSELSTLTLKFGENLLAETNKNFKLEITDENDLDGVSDDVRDAAKTDKGTWVFTLQKPSWIPFLSSAKNRALREKLYRGYFMRGDNDNADDNKEVIKKIITLRDEKAKLLAYDNFASYVIDANMAKTPSNVYDLLAKLWDASLPVSKKELADMQQLSDKEGSSFKLDSWDWWYYSEKVRKDKYDLDENELKPYFSLDNAKKGIFYVSERLYGLKFVERKDLPKYNDEVEAYDVQEADGTHIAVLYMDYHPRPGKGAGAWCTRFRGVSYDEQGTKTSPVVSVVCNFTRPVGNQPALLSLDEVETLFHEFGHALHSFFADGPYRRTAGKVPRDFVEMPSQVLEHWAVEPEVLKVYAKHFQTGETIPDALIEKMNKSRYFNQGFITVEYLAAALLDMDWHTADVAGDIDVRAFEKSSMEKYGLISEIKPRYRSTYFSHIFDGGYAAGYYVYIWAAVLDSDAFQAFKETGDIFNPDVAKKFRTMLKTSGSDDAEKIYETFRGRQPDITPLLRDRGFVK